MPQGPGLRFDGGVTAGAPVTADFDSMLAKLVATDRRPARWRSRACAPALADTVMLGVTLNADFLSRVLQHPAFARGEIDTSFLDRHRESLKPTP